MVHMLTRLTTRRTLLGLTMIVLICRWVTVSCDLLVWRGEREIDVVAVSDFAKRTRSSSKRFSILSHVGVGLHVKWSIREAPQIFHALISVPTLYTIPFKKSPELLILFLLLSFCTSAHTAGYFSAAQCFMASCFAFGKELWNVPSLYGVNISSMSLRRQVLQILH